ncbi:hypothetical protein BFR57_02510 [Idiomarina sp. MD25a]|uniref:GSCFA domain-containing protein n=1 Tax=Idiomarina sp. MD25a TaxID=1889913 RepID=UPI0008F94798|nr:GSCFA domain-containing protein [Idiomarina sp. MD25a]OIM99457.1 hypothetical protein BFR57_02510 [Idiomarina sp. MD25a]
MKNPYENIPERRFWRSGVQSQSVFSIKGLYNKAYEIEPSDKIATAGSCFAQHISKRLSEAGYNFMDVEKAPTQFPQNKLKEYGFNTYSARYGNIYTARQLQELAAECFDPPDQILPLWCKDGRFYDALRPNIEPKGYSSVNELTFHRLHHLDKLRYLFTEMDVFVFTLGLTEYWECLKSNRALPIAPGVIAGDYDPENYAFRNQTCSEVIDSFTKFMDTINSHRDKPCRFILTVSPVPLIATAEDGHVLLSTTYSKSVLRAAAGELTKKYSNIDYFPSYEIITAPCFRGIFYDVDQRNIVSQGVDTVMRVFFQEHPPLDTISSSKASAGNKGKAINDGIDEDPMCEEALLEGFAR